MEGLNLRDRNYKTFSRKHKAKTSLHWFCNGFSDMITKAEMTKENMDKFSFIKIKKKKKTFVHYMKLSECEEIFVYHVTDKGLYPECTKHI